MFFRKPFSYTISIKNDTIIGVILGALILFIIFFLKPFDTGSSNLPYKNLYFLGYGIITFLSYLLSHLISTLYYKHYKNWFVFNDFFFCLAFIITAIIIAFYYTEVIINHKPERTKNINYALGWFRIVFIGFGVLLSFFTIYLRSKIKKTESISQIKLCGSLKKDSFSIEIKKLVYIKSENNYLNIYYFNNKTLNKKLLRSTLTNIVKQLPSFVKVHRSYIVNPYYLGTLKGNKQNAKLHLKNIEEKIPVSASFYDDIYIKTSPEKHEINLKNK